MKKWLFILPLTIATMFCIISAPPASPMQDVSVIVNAMLMAIGAIAPPTMVPATSSSAPAVPEETVTSVPPRDFIPPMGTISDGLSYPASGLPPTRIAAFNVKTGEVSYPLPPLARIPIPLNSQRECIISCRIHSPGMDSPVGWRVDIPRPFRVD